MGSPFLFVIDCSANYNRVHCTIITSDKFSNGAKKANLAPNVAPITLIDGGKLLDLLIEYPIGIATKTVEYHEFDESKLLHLDDESLPLGEREE